MGAPIWQYVVILVLFALGAAANLVSIPLLAAAKAAKSPVMKVKIPTLNFGRLFLRTLFGIFSGYLTYSLYVWCPGTLSLGIVIFHWTSLAVRYIMMISEAGKEKDHTMSAHVYGSVYTVSMLVALIVYGVQCL